MHNNAYTESLFIKILIILCLNYGMGNSANRISRNEHELPIDGGTAAGGTLPKLRNSADSINPDVSGRSNSDDNGSDGDDIAGGCNTISKEDPDLEHLVVMINCNEYENVGERFDIIAKKLRKGIPARILALHLINITFPNSTLAANWYRGQEFMYSIEFNNISMLLITSHAFDSPVFLQMHELIFVNVDHLKIDFGMFTNVLTEIHFYDTDLLHINNNLLSPHYRTLLKLTANNFPATTDLTSFFGNRKLLWFLTVHIIGAKSQLIRRTLFAINFSRLVRINYLALVRCSIDAIQRDAFNFIGETLKTLDLTDNLLKAIDVAWFAVFLDDLKFRENYVFFDGNPIVCNCQFYEVRNLTLLAKMGERNGMLALQIHESMPRCVVHTATVQTCDTLQIISEEKICSLKSMVRPYAIAASNAFPKFAIHIARHKYENDTTTVVVIKTKFTVNFRLLILNNHSNQNVIKRKCPSLGQLKDSVACITLRGDVNAIPLIDGQLPKSQINSVRFLTTFGIVLSVANKRMWPLHIQTYRRADAGDGITDWQVEKLFALRVLFQLSLVMFSVIVLPLWIFILYKRRQAAYSIIDLDGFGIHANLRQIHCTTENNYEFGEPFVIQCRRSITATAYEEI